jgi:deferrochelatase/peroxidase EfeB
MLELDDIQHILLMRVPALTGRYEFLSFRSTTGGRTWLSAIKEKVQSAAEVRASVEKEKRWVTVALTWNGLRALGVDEDSLATFPEEFRQGMVARAEMLGDTGENHPNNWVGGLASPSLHAIVILFAGDEAERERCVMEHNKFISQCRDVEVLSSLDLQAVPPFIYAHDHFGYRDRLSQPVIEGSGEVPTPGSGAPRNPKFYLETAASWLIGGCKSMWASSATFYARMLRLPRNRNFSQRSSWAAGEAVHRSCCRLTKTTRN